MSNLAQHVATAFSSNTPISRSQFLAWLDATPDSDLPTLAKLYRLTAEHYSCIQPELGRDTTCSLIRRYLLACIRDGISGNPEIQERYEAAGTLHNWFLQLLATPDTAAVLTHTARAITNLYLTSGQEVRDAIENGFLEHALETAALRPYFEYWANDARLQPAWQRALAWALAHPEYVADLNQRLSRSDKK